MEETRDDRPADAPLNPAMHATSDTSHGTTFHGTDPMKTVSVKDADEGSSWPMIWAAVAILGLLVTVYLLVT